MGPGTTELARKTNSHSEMLTCPATYLYSNCTTVLWLDTSTTKASCSKKREYISYLPWEVLLCGWISAEGRQLPVTWQLAQGLLLTQSQTAKGTELTSGWVETNWYCSALWGEKKNSTSKGPLHLLIINRTFVQGLADACYLWTLQKERERDDENFSWIEAFEAWVRKHPRCKNGTSKAALTSDSRRNLWDVRFARWHCWRCLFAHRVSLNLSHSLSH